MGLLTKEQVSAALQSLDGWEQKGIGIQKKFVHKDFVRAMGFVQSVALLAEKVNHHPDIDIRWNIITLTLSTHSAGGLTEKDMTLAKEIDLLIHTT